MSRRAKWWLSALLVSAEILTVGALVWTGEARRYAREIYVRGWHYLEPDVPPPDRFLSK